MKIVFNSSPLIFLSQLGFLEKFLDSNDNFYLPATVQQKINAKQDQSSETLNKLINQQKLIILNITELPPYIYTTIAENPYPSMDAPP